MGKPAKPRTKFPYYKVQVFDNRNLSWKDFRREAFDTLDDAEKYVDAQGTKQRLRILVVEERQRHPLA